MSASLFKQSLQLGENHEGRTLSLKKAYKQFARTHTQIGLASRHDFGKVRYPIVPRNALTSSSFEPSARQMHLALMERLSSLVKASGPLGDVYEREWVCSFVIAHRLGEHGEDLAHVNLFANIVSASSKAGVVPERLHWVILAANYNDSVEAPWSGLVLTFKRHLQARAAPLPFGSDAFCGALEHMNHHDVCCTLVASRAHNVSITCQTLKVVSRKRSEFIVHGFDTTVDAALVDLTSQPCGDAPLGPSPSVDWLGASGAHRRGDGSSADRANDPASPCDALEELRAALGLEGRRALEELDDLFKEVGEGSDSEIEPDSEMDEPLPPLPPPADEPGGPAAATPPLAPVSAATIFETHSEVHDKEVVCRAFGYEVTPQWDVKSLDADVGKRAGRIRCVGGDFMTAECSNPEHISGRKKCMAKLDCAGAFDFVECELVKWIVAGTMVDREEHERMAKTLRLERQSVLDRKRADRAARAASM